jgi:hypothetical protein
MTKIINFFVGSGRVGKPRDFFKKVGSLWRKRSSGKPNQIQQPTAQLCGDKKGEDR